MGKKTLFEELNEELEYENGRSPFFYRRAYRRLTSKYLSSPERFIRDERGDSSDLPENQDKNVLRRAPRQGHIFMFEYKNESKNIKVFDPFPLVYVIRFDGRSFTGSNLHYIHPIKRKYVLENLQQGRLTIPYNSLSKYNMGQIKGLLLDVAFDEWMVAANLPIEEFFTIKDGKDEKIAVSDVWKQNNKTFRNMLRGARIYKGYGKNDADFKGN